jgi:hypothetical protein
MRPFRGLLLLALFVGAGPASTSALAQMGGVRTGFEDFSFVRPGHNHWSVYRLSAWQGLANAGRLSMDLDWVYGNAPASVNHAGRISLALTGFRWSRWTADAVAGDSELKFTNLRERFANAFYLDLYVRGGRLTLSSPSSEIAFFGGRLARLEGYNGRSFALTDESLFGFKGRFQIDDSFALGAGFIRTGNETDDLGVPVTKNNRILLLDSEIGLSRRLTWISEFRMSDAQDPSGGPRDRDLSLRFGTIYGGDAVHFEANYRYAGAGYHFVNAASQGDPNQQTLFALGRVSPLGWLTVFGNVSFAADAGEDGRAFPPSREIRSLLGLSISPPKGPALSVFTDAVRRRPDPHVPGSSDFFLSSIYGELRHGGSAMNGYLRFRRFAYGDHLYPLNAYDQMTGTAGVLRTIAPGLSLYFEGEGERRDLAGGIRETRLRGRSGFHYDSGSGFSLWGEAGYTRLSTHAGRPAQNALAAFLGLSLSLPRGIQIFADARYDRVSEDVDRLFTPPGLRFQVRLTKAFGWGAPERIAGRRSGPGVDGGSGSISGMVFDDANGNGLLDPGEKGLPRFALRLEDGSTVQTAADGTFRFPRVAVGEHLVSLDARHIPIEFNVLGPSEQRAAVSFRGNTRMDFRVVSGARLSGRVVFDENGNGRAEYAEKGVPDVLVYLLPGGGINTFTDAEGNFEFQNLDPASYVVKIDEQTLPEGHVLVPPAEFKRSLAPGENAYGLVFLIKEKIIFIPMDAAAPAPASTGKK